MSEATEQKVYAEWISGVEAAEIIGCGEQQVPKLAKLGRITTKQLPGNLSRRKYLRDDCFRVRDSAIQKATAYSDATVVVDA